MIEKIILDIEKALDNEAYLSALTLVLTIPDICGKAEFPNEGNNKRRYIDWYDKYVGAYEQSSQTESDGLPYLSGEVVYSLRNNMLHQGTPNIEKKSIKNENNKVDNFVLVIEKKKEFDIYVDAAGILETEDGIVRNYRVNIRRLCLILCLSAKGYYKNNISKFNFFNYTILDWDEELEKIRHLKG